MPAGLVQGVKTGDTDCMDRLSHSPLVVDATDAHTSQATSSLSAAFEEDPVFDWIVKDDERRRERLDHAFRFELELFRQFGLTSVAHAEDGSVAGAALWARHDQWRQSLAAMLRSVPVGVRVSGVRGLPRLLMSMTAVEKQHPAEPHYYLSIIGVHPQNQGRGVAAALFEPMLKRCDRDQMPAYLEATTK